MPDDGSWRWVPEERPVEWTAWTAAAALLLLLTAVSFWVLAALGLGRVTGWW